MSFLGRRLSRDREVTWRILALCREGRLFVTPYTAALFGNESCLRVCDAPEKEAGPGDFCFLENRPVPEQGVERLFLFHWNRRYPSDLTFPKQAFRLRLSHTEDFRGFSHENVTLEEYEVLL